MGGQIVAGSAKGLYTQIRIDMPYQAAEIVTEPTTESQNGKVFTPVVDKVDVLVAGEDSPLILLIEDHHELREFIRQSLAGRYRLITAADGEEGIAL